MHAVLFEVLGWLLSKVVLKFVIVSIIFVVVGALVPMVVAYLTPFLGLDALTDSFSGFSAGVCYFLNFFRLSFGLPLLISAFVARFLIRRIPFIG